MRTALAFLLLFPAALHAEPLKAVLVVPPSMVSGADFYLDASQSTGEIEHYVFEVVKHDGSESFVIPTGDASKPRAPSFVGDWTIKLLVIAKDGRSDKTKARCVITADGDCPKPKPDPTPGPEPDPQPDPPIPPKPDVGPPVGEFGIAPKVYTLAKSVKSPQLAAECKSLADACDVLAAQIAAGTLTDPQVLLNQMGTAMQGVSASWNDTKPAIQKGLEDVYKANSAKRLKVAIGLTGAKMVDPSGWRQLLVEIGSGFRAVK